MKLEGGPSENGDEGDEWLSRASLLLSPLSITPVPYSTQCLEHRPSGAFRLQIHILMYPSFHTFLFSVHQRFHPGVTLERPSIHWRE